MYACWWYNRRPHYSSYIVEYDTFNNLYYVTDASLPCLSVFKPLLQEETLNECTNKGIKYWLEREFLIRYIISGQVDKKAYLIDKKALESKMLEKIKTAKNKEEIKLIIADINNEEQMLINKYLQLVKNINHKFKLGNTYYRKYWQKKTATLKKLTSEFI